MKPQLLLALLLFPILATAQSGITFKVEDLKKPEELLGAVPYKNILKELISSDAELHVKDIEENNIKLPYNIVAKSKHKDSLVNSATIFFNEMYQAYADHRPFTISPDMMWL